MAKRTKQRPAQSDRQAVTFGDLVLMRRIMRGGHWIEISSLTMGHIETHLIERAAGELFPDALLVGDDLGPLVRLDVLAPVLYAAGLDKWAVHLPHVAHLDAANAPRAEQPRPIPAATDPLSGRQVRELHALLIAGHTVDDAARTLSLNTRVARRLLNGGFNVSKLSDDVRAAYLDTFGVPSAGVYGPLAAWLASRPAVERAALCPEASAAPAAAVQRRTQPYRPRPADPSTPDLDFGS